MIRSSTSSCQFGVSQFGVRSLAECCKLTNSELNNSERGLTPLSLPTCHSSLLFVYGTLRRGGEGHRLLQRRGVVYVGKGIVAGELYDLGSYPGALKSQDLASRVVGEVYRLSNATQALQRLDEYEGVRPSGPQPASTHARSPRLHWRMGSI